MFRKLFASVIAFCLILGLVAPAHASFFPSQLGGDGSDGSVTISSNTTESASVSKNFGNLTVNSGSTYTVKSGSLIKALGSVNINGTLAGTAEMNGGFPSSLQAGGGAGPAGGEGGYGLGSGGGGACGGNGGNGWYPSYARGGMSLYPFQGCTGSGGGGGYAYGGNGGAALNVMTIGQITVGGSGIIRANGTAGQDGSSGGGGAGGGGGGSGGCIGLYSEKGIANGNTIEAKGGGQGPGNGSYGYGGGGGGGIVLRMSPNNTGNNPVVTKGGPGDEAQPATNGLSISITGVPTVPTLTAHQNHFGAMIMLSQWVKFRNNWICGTNDETEVRFGHKENAQFMAALEPEKNFYCNVIELVHGDRLEEKGIKCEAVGFDLIEVPAA